MSYKTKVVLIDSGIDLKNNTFYKKNIEYFSVEEKNGDMFIDKNAQDYLGHGTAISNILIKESKDIELIVFKIFDSELKTSIEMLVFTLNYIYLNLECDIINLSLGVDKGNSELYEICNKFKEKNIFIISAFNNSGSISYPAAYDSVIGVDANMKCKKNNDFFWLNNSLVNVLAKGGNHRLLWINNNYIISQGSSFSTAYVTAKFANLISSGIKKETVIEEFKSNCLKIINFENTFNNCDNIESLNIKKVAIFPYNKEIHSIINFPELLPFSIEKIYDSKYSGNINKTIYNLNKKNKFKIFNIDEVSFKNIDTFIIGHTKELENLIKINYKEDLLKKCLDNNVNVYVFDDYLVETFKEKFKQKGLFLFNPKMELLNLYKYKFNKQFKIASPVIGVFGTTRHQGKFTLQLKLRKLFQENDYKVGQLGSEPTSKLFNMDFMYSFGYESNLSLNNYNMVDYLNSIMHKIDEKNVDIIIVGSQSGTVPLIFDNLGQIPLDQLNFLLGTLPDVVILCVNLTDNINYIKRTIKVIENLAECKVLAIAIYPIVYSNQWTLWNGKKDIASENIINNFKKIITNELNINSFVIGNDLDERALFNYCIEYLSD